MRLNRPFVLTIIATAGIAQAATIGYYQTNLTSDIPGLAANFDPLLKNPWGMSFSATSPFWLSDQGSNVATLYSGTGVPNALVVATPPVPGPGPTGQVFAGGLGFAITPGVNANFIFSTLAGTIDAWNSGTTAVLKFGATDGAVYTGLAQAGSLLYAADNKNGKIDVINNAFAKTTVTGNFIDPNIPAGFTPYNIQNIGGKLYVTYSKEGSGAGFVGVFDTNGNFLQHISDSHLNEPWGVTIAPAGFGQFGSDLLVGDVEDGLIHAFDPATGAFLGTIAGVNGNPLVNDGLWAINFRAAGSGFDPNTLFFAAGINGENDGLFGSIQAVPEPGTLGMVGLVMLGGILARVRRRFVRSVN